MDYGRTYIKIGTIEGNELVDGADFPIYGVSDPLEPASNTVIFVKNTFDFKTEVKECIVVTKKHLDIDKSNRQVISSEPKKDYANILSKLQKKLPVFEKYEENGSVISRNARIGSSTRIGRFCVIEDDVVIGEECEVGDYTYIGSHTRIGDKVSIREKCMIGISDADIYRTESCCLTLLHLAGTIIEDGCLCLAGAHIASGDTRPTVIMRGSMVGIGANIGHNSLVGEKVLVGAHACVCGHCVIGDNSYVAPSATIMNRLHVGKNVNVGIGSVVLQDIEDGVRVFGNPAMPTMPLKFFRKG